MNFTFKDSVWLVGVFVALGATWGMTSQRVTAMEADLDRMETAIQIFTKIETRIAVIETEVKNINLKLERMSK
jgi:predicted RNA methylase|tara:strand:+ start:7342 stop:7560 length:219 start_codon:yes stop_codon:yes gene_type:complete